MAWRVPASVIPPGSVVVGEEGLEPVVVGKVVGRWVVLLRVSDLGAGDKVGKVVVAVGRFVEAVAVGTR